MFLNESIRRWKHVKRHFIFFNIYKFVSLCCVLS